MPDVNVLHETMKRARKVEDVQPRARDAAGDEIAEVCAVRVPDYAVYILRESGRVRVHFSDAPETDREQRRKLTIAVGPKRAELASLLERMPEACRRTYNGAQVSAFVTVLDAQDTSEAATAAAAAADGYMTAAIRRAQAEADGLSKLSFVTQARNYLVVSLLAMLVLLLCLYLWKTDHAGRVLLLGLCVATIGGLLGAAFSAAVGLRNRALRLDEDGRTNAIDAALRLAVGGMAGGVIYLMLAVGGPLFIGMENATAPPKPDGWAAILLFGFLAGFAERLVPGLLDKAANRLNDGKPAGG